MQLENQIEQITRDIENGNTDLQPRLEELKAQKAEAGANYDAAVARVKELMDDNTGAE